MGIFQVQFFLHLTWQDSRLKFYNLKDDTGLNALSPQEKEILWIPVLTFENTENKPFTLADEKTSITVKKQGEFSLSKVEDVENQQFFEGKENSMTMSRFYNIRFICNYQMQWYPFDVQRCKLVLAMQGKSSDFARLHAQVLQFIGREEVNQYVVISYTMLVSEKAELEIEVMLGRRLLTIILTTIVTTVLLNVISYATNHFKAIFFEAIVTVNLTAMLVQTTLFIEVSNGLPPTSYIKMIEYYLIFCLLVPCVEVLLHTVMDSLRLDEGLNEKEEAEPKPRMINHHGKSIAVKPFLMKTVSESQLIDNGASENGGGRGILSFFLNNRDSTHSTSSETPVPMVRDVLKSQNLTMADLMARNETDEINARENLYRSANTDGKMLNILQTFANKGIPLIFCVVQISFWTIGLANIYYG